MNFTPAIKHIIIANAIFFGITALFLPPFKELTAIWYFENPNFNWWQILSHMFMHGNLMHIFFNMFALWSFGSPLEHIWGSNRFLLFYFICGIGAALFHIGVNYYDFQKGFSVLINHGYTSEQIYNILKQGKIYSHWEQLMPRSVLEDMVQAFMTPAVGASGAIYGVLVAFGMLFPNAELMLIFLPIPIKAKFFIPILLLIDLFSGVTGFSIFGGNVAHFAHLGGAIIGFVLMWLWKRNSLNDKRWA